MKKSIAIVIFSIVSIVALIIVALKMFVFTPIYTINQLQSAISNLDTALFLEYAKFHQSKDDDTTPHDNPNSANEWETFDYVMESSANKMHNSDFEIRDFRTYLPADSEIIKHSYTKSEQGAIVRIYSRDKHYYNIPMYSEIHMQRFGWKYIAVSRNRNASLTRCELIVAATSRYRADATFRPLIIISAKRFPQVNSSEIQPKSDAKYIISAKNISSEIIRSVEYLLVKKFHPYASISGSIDEIGPGQTKTDTISRNAHYRDTNQNLLFDQLLMLSENDIEVMPNIITWKNFNSMPSDSYPSLEDLLNYLDRESPDYSDSIRTWINEAN